MERNYIWNNMFFNFIQELFATLKYQKKDISLACNSKFINWSIFQSFSVFSLFRLPSFEALNSMLIRTNDPFFLHSRKELTFLVSTIFAFSPIFCVIPANNLLIFFAFFLTTASKVNHPRISKISITHFSYRETIFKFI